VNNFGSFWSESSAELRSEVGNLMGSNYSLQNIAAREFIRGLLQAAISSLIAGTAILFLFVDVLRAW
jgi:hypothetical protein